jgi:hypothetical protein
VPALDDEDDGDPEAGEAAGIPDIEFVSITLDPAYDTPGVLHDYADARHIDTSNFSFLTGPEPAIRDLLTQFGVIAEFKGDILNHTLATLLIDEKGASSWRADGSSLGAEGVRGKDAPVTAAARGWGPSNGGGSPSSRPVAVLFFVVRELPTGTNLSHMDFRVQGGNVIEFCDPANPQFLPVVAVRSPVTLARDHLAPAWPGPTSTRRSSSRPSAASRSPRGPAGRPDSGSTS